MSTKNNRNRKTSLRERNNHFQQKQWDKNHFYKKEKLQQHRKKKKLEKQKNKKTSEEEESNCGLNRMKGLFRNPKAHGKNNSPFCSLFWPSFVLFFTQWENENVIRSELSLFSEITRIIQNQNPFVFRTLMVFHIRRLLQIKKKRWNWIQNEIKIIR